MKELNEMTYEELKTMTKKLEEEKERRKKLVRETYEERLEILNEIKDTFDKYYYIFHEFPFIKYGANKPIEMDMDILANNEFEYPCLFLYR